MPQVIPADESGIFAITRRGQIDIYRQFVDFVTALDEALAAGEKVTRINAHGDFDDQLFGFRSSRLRIGLTN